MSMTLVGYPSSPFVRKVRLVLETKQLDYQLNPLNPFLHAEQVEELTGQGKVPVLLVNGETWFDSAEICRKLDTLCPEPAVIPKEKNAREQVEAIEAFADSGLAQAFHFGLFMQRVIKPYVLRRSGDQQVVAEALSQWIPNALSSLEMALQSEHWRRKQPGVADFAVGSMVRNGLLAGYQFPCRSYPMAASYLKMIFDLPAFKTVLEQERFLPELQQANGDWGYAELSVDPLA